MGRNCPHGRTRNWVELYTRAYWQYYTAAALWVGGTSFLWMR